MKEITLTDEKGNKGIYKEYENETEFLNVLVEDRDLCKKYMLLVNRMLAQDAKNTLFCLWNKK